MNFILSFSQDFPPPPAVQEYHSTCCSVLKNKRNNTKTKFDIAHQIYWWCTLPAGVFRYLSPTFMLYVFLLSIPLVAISEILSYNLSVLPHLYNGGTLLVLSTGNFSFFQVGCAQVIFNLSNTTKVRL